jgi:hypothetical protein
MGNCIPAGQHALWRYDVDLLRAGVQIEPGALHRGCIDGEALCTIVAVKQPEPGNPGLADFTLAVIEHKSSISHDPPSLQLYGHPRDAGTVVSRREGSPEISKTVAPPSKRAAL